MANIIPTSSPTPPNLLTAPARDVLKYLETTQQAGVQYPITDNNGEAVAAVIYVVGRHETKTILNLIDSASDQWREATPPAAPESQKDEDGSVALGIPFGEARRNDILKKILDALLNGAWLCPPDKKTAEATEKMCDQLLDRWFIKPFLELNADNVKWLKAEAVKAVAWKPEAPQS